jgi:hypothetical protein
VFANGCSGMPGQYLLQATDLSLTINTYSSTPAVSCSCSNQLVGFALVAINMFYLLLTCFTTCHTWSVLLMSTGVITALPTSSSVLPLLSSLRQSLYFCTRKASTANKASNFCTSKASKASRPCLCRPPTHPFVN